MGGNEALGKQRMREMLAQGVTTMEGKSGYGLDEACELKMLSVMQELKQESCMDLAVTYLALMPFRWNTPGAPRNTFAF